MLSKIDCILIDPVELERDKLRTKSTLGGGLTIVLVISTLLSLILLFVYNETKQDIHTVELLSSTHIITNGLPFKIEWEPEVIDASYIELVTQSNKKTNCYSTIDKHNNFKVNDTLQLCPYGTDLYGENNGVGFVIQYNKTFVQKSILPIEPIDTVMYMLEDEYVYVIHTARDELCVYTLSKFTHNCVPYKYSSYYDNGFVFNFNMNAFEDYFSIEDNKGSIYLFKKDKLVSNILLNSYDYEQSSYNFISNTTIMYVNGNNTDNYRKNITIVDTTTNTPVYSTTFYLYSKFYRFSWDKYVMYYQNVPSVTNTTFSIKTFNAVTRNIGIIDTIIYNNGSIISNMDGMYFYFTYPTPYNETNIVQKTQNTYVYIMLEHIDKIKGKITITSVIIDYKMSTVRFNTTTIQNKLYMNDTKLKTFFYRGFGTVSNSLFYMILTESNYYLYDMYLFNSDNTVASFGLFNFATQLYDITLSIINIYKVNADTYLLYTMSPFVTIGNKTVSTGGLLVCTLSVCKPKYTTVSSMYDDNQSFNPKVATISYNDFKHELYLQDVLPTHTLKSELMINTYAYNHETVDNHPSFSIGTPSAKRLYSMRTSSASRLNFTTDPNTNYYVFDNTQSGHDQKFTCYSPVMDLDYFLLFESLVFLDNRKTCIVNTYNTIPFIFQDKYFIMYDIDRNNRVIPTESRILGMFLLSIDSISKKTTITPTKQSPFSIIGSVGGLFSTLFTVMIFIKGRVRKYKHKQFMTASDTYTQKNEQQHTDQVAIDVQQLDSIQKLNEIRVQKDQI